MILITAVLITIFACWALIYATDSFFNREAEIYAVLATRPYLKREQILTTYKTFKHLPLDVENKPKKI